MIHLTGGLCTQPSLLIHKLWIGTRGWVVLSFLAPVLRLCTLLGQYRSCHNALSTAAQCRRFWQTGELCAWKQSWRRESGALTRGKLSLKDPRSPRSSLLGPPAETRKQFEMLIDSTRGNSDKGRFKKHQSWTYPVEKFWRKIVAKTVIFNFCLVSDNLEVDCLESLDDEVSNALLINLTALGLQAVQTSKQLVLLLLLIFIPIGLGLAELFERALHFDNLNIYRSNEIMFVFLT